MAATTIATTRQSTTIHNNANARLRYTIIQIQIQPSCIYIYIILGIWTDIYIWTMIYIYIYVYVLVAYMDRESPPEWFVKTSPKNVYLLFSLSFVFKEIYFFVSLAICRQQTFNFNLNFALWFIRLGFHVNHVLSWSRCLGKSQLLHRY